MKTKTIAGLMGICLVLSATGCSKSASTAPASNTTAATAATTATTATTAATEAETTESETATAEEALDLETMDIIKYNIYIEMNNYMLDILDNIYSYYTVVEYSDEFAFVPDSGYDYKYDISPLDSSIVDEALAVAAMDPSYDVLDELTQQIAEPMKALMDTFSDIYSCYDFADNQYAKAKELHIPIQAYSAEFEELADSFMEEIDVLSDERVREDEQQMLESGMLIAYNASHSLTVASQILDECYGQDVADANITDLDLTNIKPLYDELVSTVSAFNDAVNDPNQLMLESLSSSTPMYGLLDSLVQSVEWMIKQVESQTPIPDPGREYLGGIIHIEEVLSDCIDQYNSVFAE